VSVDTEDLRCGWERGECSCIRCAAAAEIDELRKERESSLAALDGLPEFSLVEQCQKRQSQLNDLRAHVAALEDGAMGVTVYLGQLETRLAESELAHEATKRELEELRKLAVLSTDDLRDEVTAERARRESAERALRESGDAWNKWIANNDSEAAARAVQEADIHFARYPRENAP
jgi:hypothetical protein